MKSEDSKSTNIDGGQVSSSKVEAAIGLALTHRERGDLGKGIEVLQEACKAHAERADVWMLLGIFLKQAGHLQEAEGCLKKSARLDPAQPDVQNNLGNLYGQMGKGKQALAHYRKALELDGNHFEAANNLGKFLAARGMLGEAVGILRRLTQKFPDNYRTHSNLGVAFLQNHKPEEAERCLRRALALRKDFPEGYANLGSALVNQNRLEEAVECLDRAIELKPGLAEPHWNKAIVCLRQGNFAEGWELHEWRFRQPGYPVFHPEAKRWDGSDQPDKTLLLYAEQGFGDAIQFIRYVPELAKKFRRVLVECQPELAPLFEQAKGVKQVFSRGRSLQKFDVAIPMLSVPLMLKTGMESIPAEVPYFSIGKEGKKEGAFAHEETKLAVGIAWAGNARHRQDPVRSCSLEEWLPLLKTKGVRFVSLQKGAASQELRGLSPEVSVEDAVEKCEDFLDTAKVVASLDLVISVDTAVAHLAGALARPVWTLVQYAPDWRWMLDRKDTPWYPTMRLFRQKTYGDWEAVIAEMKGELESLLAG